MQGLLNFSALHPEVAVKIRNVEQAYLTHSSCHSQLDDIKELNSMLQSRDQISILQQLREHYGF